jgi:hypothetical protein
MPSSDLAFERVCIRPLFDINSHYIFVHKIWERISLSGWSRGTSQ